MPAYASREQPFPSGLWRDLLFGQHPFAQLESSVADLLFVVLTGVLFAALTVLIKAVERG
ncbi:hypothetical protein [Actinoplanes sp. NPDC026670]|uniref:hypothetical protein n=1 Tax=Actinoplanes sp. NPDC026670 TaxID=3154700 RepID=UPI0033C00FF9